MRVRVIRILALGGAALAGLAAVAPSGATAQDGSGSREVTIVELDGAIDRVTARFLSRALDDAESRGSELVVVRLDTPGGLVDAMRDMVGDIFASPVPVVVFVAPEGARAASAGTFVTAAAGIAAMAPATNIGAASVVGGQGEDLPETLGRKATQDAAALLRSIAERRDRDVEALEATVFEATSYSADEALDEGIIDLVAADLDDLLRRLDGAEVPVQGGVVVLDTTDLRHRVVELNAFERVLAFVSDPTITFLLLSFGGLAIVTELLHFGAVFPGVIGVTMLVLGFAGVGQLPFSWAGVALIVLAMALFFAEAQAPGIGFFGVTGAIALVLGGLFLVGFFGAPALPGSPELRVNRAVVVVMGAIAGAAMLSLAWQLRRARIPGYTSAVQREALIGEVATVTTRLDPTGAVHVAGEHWEARLPEGSVAETGTEVRVVDVVGLVLEVAATSVAAPAPGGGDTPDVAPA